MARIAGVDLPRDKRVEIGLTYIYGIGLSTAREILKKTGVNPDTRVKDLTEEEAQLLRSEIVNNHKVEGDLRREVSMNIKRLMDTAWDCPAAVSAPRRMPVRGRTAKDVHVPSPVRRPHNQGR